MQEPVRLSLWDMIERYLNCDRLPIVSDVILANHIARKEYIFPNSCTLLMPMPINFVVMFDVILKTTMKTYFNFALTVFFALVMFSCTDNNKGCEEVTPAENAAFENIMTRSSVRSYSDRQISNDTVNLLLKAAVAAPTAVNSQPWHFVVLRNMEKREKLAELLPNAGSKLTSSSVNILVCGDTRKFLEKAPTYWIQDCSAATENLLLAANALGLGAVWCGIYPIEERVKYVTETLELDPNLIPLCIIPVGYPDKPAQMKDKWKEENITEIN